VSARFQAGELVGIIGPNGAGKTTVLDLICGKTPATSGSVKFKGKELRGTKEYKIVRAGIGRKFQNPSIYENLTVFENLELSHPSGRGVIGCLLFRRTPEIMGQCKSVAEQIGLLDKLDTEAGILSHGQKQWLDRDAADAGPRSHHAGRTRRRHERARTHGNRHADPPHFEGPLGDRH
jgi:urea transport system ATP-binding protein